jgi:hypothetical protein
MHEKHAVATWESSQHLLEDGRKSKETCVATQDLPDVHGSAPRHTMGRVLLLLVPSLV